MKNQSAPQEKMVYWEVWWEKEPILGEKEPILGENDRAAEEKYT